MTDHDESPNPVTARDRLAATLFLAAVLHGVFIMGVTFSAADFPLDRGEVATLNVTVVVPDEGRQDAALPGGPGVLPPGALPAGEAAPPVPADQPGAQTNLEAATRERAPDTAAAAPRGSRESATLSPPERYTGSGQARELTVSPDIRDPTVAAYLTAWKARVERVGTRNYPHQARQAAAEYGFPVLEVAVGADGALREAVIRHSSGQPLLDQAALQILRLAAPFEPFPEDLNADYDVLRFAYEWQFNDIGDADAEGRLAQ